MARRIFIGDVQGCRDELERLLELVRFDPAGDELQPVGDLVNRGPDSAGVLRLMRELDAGGVLGNHDLHCLHIAAGRRSTKSRDTLGGLLESDDRDELLDWLAARPFVRVWPDLILVHAALHPLWEDPLEELKDGDPLEPDENVRFAVSARTCDADGRQPRGNEAANESPFEPWFHFYRPKRHGKRTVVFGHWAMRGLVQAPHLRGLDTGCVWGRELTAWIAEEDRLVQVAARRTYSPY